MNHSKLYVPDPNLWINFFRKSSQKRVINQKGGNKVLSAKQSNEPMNVELISPVEAADERTQSAIKRLRKKTTSGHLGRGTHIKRAKSKSSRRRKIVKSKRRKAVKPKTNRKKPKKVKRKTRKKKKSVKFVRDIFSK